MPRSGRPPAYRVTVLIIVDNPHAAEVSKAVHEYNDLCNKTSPVEVKINGAIVTALQMIYNKPDGWYDAEFREKLARSITPRLTRKEFVEVMAAVYAVVPPREEDPKVQLLRVDRRQKIAKKS